MSAPARRGIAPAGWSIALHAVLAGMLYLGLSVPTQDPEPMTLPIDAVIVDQAVIQAASRLRRDDDRRVAEEQRREREAAEAQERERQEDERRVTEAEERRQAEAAAEQKARAAADAKRKAETEAKRRTEQQAQVKVTAEKKRAAEEARQRDQREADLKKALAEEDVRTGTAFQGLKAQYVRAIQAHVEQRWYEPPGIASGMSCTVIVSQIPGGEVTGMRFGSCNGSPAVRQSIETAVRKSSPLPPPPEPTLFAREVQLVFTPKESRR